MRSMSKIAIRAVSTVAVLLPVGANTRLEIATFGTLTSPSGSPGACCPPRCVVRTRTTVTCSAIVICKRLLLSVPGESFGIGSEAPRRHVHLAAVCPRRDVLLVPSHTRIS